MAEAPQIELVVEAFAEGEVDRLRDLHLPLGGGAVARGDRRGFVEPLARRVAAVVVAELDAPGLGRAEAEVGA